MDEMKIPEPQSRKEYFLRKIAYPDAPCPAPETREEEYLDAIAQNKGGGGEPSGGGDVFVVEMNPQTQTLDKTWQEIYDAIASGKAAYIHAAVSGVVAMLSPIILIQQEQGYLLISLEANIGGILPLVFVAASADGYPVHEQS